MAKFSYWRSPEHSLSGRFDRVVRNRAGCLDALLALYPSWSPRTRLQVHELLQRPGLSPDAEELDLVREPLWCQVPKVQGYIYQR